MIYIWIVYKKYISRAFDLTLIIFPNLDDNQLHRSNISNEMGCKWNYCISFSWKPNRQSNYKLSTNSKTVYLFLCAVSLRWNNCYYNIYIHSLIFPFLWDLASQNISRGNYLGTTSRFVVYDGGLTVLYKAKVWLPILRYCAWDTHQLCLWKEWLNTCYASSQLTVTL